MDAAKSGANDLPCVWALAGVLNYRLCDRGYDCDHCELFHVLRGGGSVADAPPAPERAGRRGVEACDAVVEGVLARLTDGCTLHLDRPYSPSHFWVRMREEDAPKATLGLDDFALRVLQPIQDIAVPRVGIWLQRGEPCGWLARGHSAIPLTAPLSGEIVEVNRRWVDAVRHGDLGGPEGWLLRVHVHEDPDDVSDLFRGEETLRWYLGRLQAVRDHLHAATTPADPRVGVAMADGGAPTPDLERILGRERFATLVAELFGHQI